MAVDLSMIGCSWVVSQQIEEVDYPIVFGSVTFNQVESRYSQPKLELYGVFRALNAERFRLHGIHFRLVLDASYIGKMINSPGLPNAVMTRWIAYILLFDFEIEHRLATKHRGPDGLSRRRHAKDDSSNSSVDSEPDKGIKLVKVPKSFDSLHDTENECDQTLEIMTLEHLMGECLPLEVHWTEPLVLDAGRQSFETLEAFEGEVIMPDDDTAAEKLRHQHKAYKHDSPDYWNKILAYLTNLKLPEDRKRRSQIANRARHFFVLDNMLW
jgi:RNase H-like domain found in reverse transcriptase